MNQYYVEVRYRTSSGCNVRRITLAADDMAQAMEIATDRVRHQRGVIRIDGGDCRPMGGNDNGDI